MEVLLIALLSLYTIGGLGWFFHNLMGYSFEWKQVEKRKHARNLILTPIWPFYGITLLSLKLKEMWDYSGLGDDLKKLQNNTQKEKNKW